MLPDYCKYFVPSIVGAVIFLNHYARDCPGALQVQMQGPPLYISSAQYGTLNSSYFLPNMIMPLIVGILGQRYGAANLWLCSLTVGAIGHMIFGIGVTNVMFGVMVTGRTVVGFAYEAIDMVSIGVAAPLFSEHWDVLAGLVNGFLRLGSVTNFIVTPAIYNTFGIKTALWLASILGACGLLGGLAIKWLDGRLSKHEKLKQTSKVSFSEFTPGYWMYILCGLFMYGSIVPFWFFGSKFIQERWSYSLQSADLLTLMPEGIISVVAPTLGFIVNKSWSAQLRLLYIGGGCWATMVVYLLLAFTYMPPWILCVCLGFTYSVTNFFYWASFASLSPPTLITLSSGIMGAATNVLPGVLPLVLAQLPLNVVMIVLGGVAGLSGAAAWASMGMRHQTPVEAGIGDVELDESTPLVPKAEP
eukprot:TRINITY_DN3290_c0_g1_i1.p1 TRINITY_DN3290_c0_g1~~TRINITY_DN3290_c0_g1_i1.p1  ORF type:complete len:416 (-),score=15.75 TRINITY_DN3290_c0_g1_i1:118-1365(-)